MTKILSQFISQEPYIIWLSFKVQGSFSYSENFDFLGCWWSKKICRILFFWVISAGKGQKTAQNDNSVCCAPNLKNYTLYDHDLWYTSVNDNISRLFFHFLKILVFQVVRRVKRQKMAQKWQKLSFVTYVSGTIHHMILIYVTHV